MAAVIALMHCNSCCLAEALRLTTTTTITTTTTATVTTTADVHMSTLTPLITS
jgi:hypothetical protein